MRIRHFILWQQCGLKVKAGANGEKCLSSATCTYGMQYGANRVSEVTRGAKVTAVKEMVRKDTDTDTGCSRERRR